jgi:hypothetical protein
VALLLVEIQRIVRPCYYDRLWETKKYDFELERIGIIFLPSFFKIFQMVYKLKTGDRETGPSYEPVSSVLKEQQQVKKLRQFIVRFSVP